MAASCVTTPEMGGWSGSVKCVVRKDVIPRSRSDIRRYSCPFFVHSEMRLFRLLKPPRAIMYSIPRVIENRMPRATSRNPPVHIIVSAKMKNCNQDLMDQPPYSAPKPRPLKPPWLYITLKIAKIQQNSRHNNQKITAIMANTLSYSEPGSQPHTNTQTQYGPSLDLNLLFSDTEHHQPEAKSPKQFLALGEFSSLELEGLANILEERTPSTLRSSHMSVSGCKRGLDNITHLLESQISTKRQKIFSCPLDIRPQAPEANRISSQDGRGSNQGNLQLNAAHGSETEGHSSPVLFPCPFYRRDPIKCRTVKKNPCIGKKWEINRLKEHLYRRHHSSTHQCSRCFETFDTADDLYKHQRARIPCPTQPDRPEIENIDDLQKSQIRQRMRGKSDVEKWEDIYRIVFRLGSSDEIPSPQEEFDIELGDGTDSSLDDFGKYLISQLRPNVGQGAELEIRACLRLMQSFKQSRSMISPITPGDTSNVSESSLNATEREQNWVDVDTLTASGQGYSVVNECTTSIELTGDIGIFPDAGLFYPIED